MGIFLYSSIALVATSLIFTVPMLAGSLGTVAWSYGKKSVNSCDVERYIGLTAFRTVSSCDHGAYSVIFYDPDDTCKRTLEGKTCDQCKDSGAATLAFVVFAFLALLTAATLQALRSQKFRFGMTPINGVLIGIVNWTACFCLFLSICIWSECQKAMKDDNKNNVSFDIELNAGWALAFLAFLFTGAAGALEIFLVPADYSMPKAREEVASHEGSKAPNEPYVETNAQPHNDGAVEDGAVEVDVKAPAAGGALPAAPDHDANKGFEGDSTAYVKQPDRVQV
mmetsp:Transcript_2765/g.5107  ORF Transcript_2765/g.5107 Transcript_2765/m.5107 type:complete len:281 (-) Transcript_2765:79-921(-)|eukprot:CAMPEP_0197536294 /NCGR_PEP_ID=MMETSP1318-20131121/53454_1 /TAXON_ID=552666 /ORGANISM="Partenskyella glossopodia, Strain RCC365" /LENGTH=280 /DNA_ID=CAMNT_0043094143 /DNA_START=101 /DNA_END=943 /DNA_ORIENTATION=-